MTEIKAKLGTKLSPEESSSHDKAKVGKTNLKADLKSGASGQWDTELVVCPYCGSAVWLENDPNAYHLYQCAACGSTFRY